MKPMKTSTKSHSKLPTEHEEQKGLLHWWRHKFPRVLIFAIPNGEKRSISVAKRLKAEGVTPGIPDLHVPEWNLWIEMKRRKGGRVSKEQREIIRYLRSIGQTVIIGQGAEDASKQILEFVQKRFDAD